MHRADHTRYQDGDVSFVRPESAFRFPSAGVVLADASVFVLSCAPEPPLSVQMRRSMAQAVEDTSSSTLRSALPEARRVGL
eukprot:3440927-Prymnesium_polylepis.2